MSSLSEENGSGGQEHRQGQGLDELPPADSPAKTFKTSGVARLSMDGCMDVSGPTVRKGSTGARRTGNAAQEYSGGATARRNSKDDSPRDGAISARIGRQPGREEEHLLDEISEEEEVPMDLELASSSLEVVEAHLRRMLDQASSMHAANTEAIEDLRDWAGELEDRVAERERKDGGYLLPEVAAYAEQQVNELFATTDRLHERCEGFVTRLDELRREDDNLWAATMAELDARLDLERPRLTHAVVDELGPLVEENLARAEREWSAAAEREHAETRATLRREMVGRLEEWRSWVEGTIEMRARDTRQQQNLAGLSARIDDTVGATKENAAALAGLAVRVGDCEEGMMRLGAFAADHIRRIAAAEAKIEQLAAAPPPPPPPPPGGNETAALDASRRLPRI